MYQVLVNIQSSSYSGVNLTSQVLKFDTMEEAEVAINELKYADGYSYKCVRLYAHPRTFEAFVYMSNPNGGSANVQWILTAMDENDAKLQSEKRAEEMGMNIENIRVYRP